jgi:hypothetical protein
MHTPSLADTFVASDPSATHDGPIVERVPDLFGDWTRAGTPRYGHVAVISIEAIALQ